MTWTEGTHTVEEMKPRARAVKDQEMAIRRAFELNEGLLDALDSEGTVEAVKQAGRYLMMTQQKIKNLFDSASPEYRHPDVWAWVVDHWYDGGLKRSVEASMHNITSTNKKAIKEKVDVLFSATEV